MDHPEIEQVMEDKYQAMKHAKVGKKRRMVMPSSRGPPTRKAQESIQRTLWILWGIWTQSSRLSQQEMRSKKDQKAKNTAQEKAAS